MRYCLDPVKQKKLNHQRLNLKALLGCCVLGLFVQGTAVSKTNVYKQINADGQVEYSDKMSEQSTEVVMPQSQINPSPATPPAAESKTSDLTTLDPAKNKQEQITIRISSPIDQQMFISVIREVPVTIIVEPKLSPTQKIKLLVDNKPFGEPQNTDTFVIKEIERGAHELKAMVLDEQGKILATSASVTFHQQRQIVKKP